MTDPQEKPLLKKAAQVFLSWDGSATSEPNVTLLRRFLQAKGYLIHEHAGVPLGSGTDEIAQLLRASTVFVIAVSQEYTRNLSCKKISLLARELKQQAPKTAAELCFVMIDGNYTTESHPHKVSGWLGHMLGASLWTPGWSHAHCAGAAEAIKGTINLKRGLVVLNKAELRAIDRGEESPLSTKGRVAAGPGKGKAARADHCGEFGAGGDDDGQQPTIPAFSQAEEGIRYGSEG